jgi:hypothetical protein
MIRVARSVDANRRLGPCAAINPVYREETVVMNGRLTLTAATVALSSMVLVACTTDPYTGQQRLSNAAGGAGIGAIAGAGLGLLAGGDDRRNALLGAGICAPNCRVPAFR